MHRTGMRLVTVLAFSTLGMFARTGSAQEPTPPAAPTTPAVPVAPGPITVAVDARNAAGKILHTHLSIPAQPGALTVVYPKWIPGEHGPTGPLNSMVNLRFAAAGRPVAWQRDPVDLYAFHCRVPAGAAALEADFDYLSMPPDSSPWLTGTACTATLAMIQWNQVVLYPAGQPTDQVQVRASLQLPGGWRYGTALLPSDGSKDGSIVGFEPVSLTTLVDSPLVAGKHYRNIPLTDPGARPSNEIDVVADGAAALDLPDDYIAKYKQLVVQAGTLFGATHYEHYHFLVVLSEHVAFNGLEHHESSLNSEGERGFIEPDGRDAFADLLPHEFTHSWNGKYRRPASLTTPDYQVPMQDDLLWVYEGLTEYFGSLVLTDRAALRPTELTHDYLAFNGAFFEGRAGRSWRPLQDTATAASVLYTAPGLWDDKRRAVDYYDEGTLLWLEADTTIRQQTGSRRSLDDFARAFYGPPGGAPRVSTYTFDDVVSTLNTVAPLDWRAWWRERLDSLAPHSVLGGIANAGWTLVFNDKPNKASKLQDDLKKITDLRFSLGLTLKEDGTVADVVGSASPAAVAGLAPGMKIVAVKGRAYSLNGLKDALKAGMAAGSPALELLVVNDDYYQTYHLDYHGGERYPHLQRDETRPDLLEVILQPRKP